VDGLHVYDVAPPAVSTVLPPGQIPIDELTVTVGSGFTVTVTDAVFVQPEVVPVTV